MPDTYKRLYQGQVPSGVTLLYTVPSGATAIVKSIRAVNTTASGVTIKFWNGGTTNANVILPAITIDAGGFADFDGTITMAASDTIYGQAGSSTSITVSIYGLEIT